MKRIVPSLLGLMLVGLPAASTWAHTSPSAARVRVTPATGSATTRFVVSYRTPDRLGSYRTSERRDVISATTASGMSACTRTVEVDAPNAPKGVRVRVALDPARSGRRWCAGTYTGQIEEIQAPVCPRGKPCPAYVILRGVVGRFGFRVRAQHHAPQTDHTPPTFGGLEQAVACTPGPQRPGQTTPFKLRWQAATDDVTPSSEIVYDVYMATAPGGENFSKPTWTTVPGASSFTTPGLPSHGTFYFVVRARDAARNEDHNAVERQGSDLCEQTA